MTKKLYRYELVARGAHRMALTDEVDALFRGPTTDVLYRLRDSTWERECLIRRALTARGETLQQGGGTFDEFGAAVERLRSLVVETLDRRVRGVSRCDTL